MWNMLSYAVKRRHTLAVVRHQWRRRGRQWLKGKEILLWRVSLNTKKHSTTWWLHLVHSSDRIIAELLERDTSLSFHPRNIHQVAIEMFMIKKELCPSFMQNLYIYNKTTDKFVCPPVHTMHMGLESLLRNFGPILWNNMIPKSIKSIPNINTFRQKLKSWIPKNCLRKLSINFVPGAVRWSFFGPPKVEKMLKR